MGDVKVCTPRPNGVFVEEAAPSLILPPSNPNPLTINAENWVLAEQLTEKLLLKVQPTKLGDEKRREIAEHVRSLIRGVSDAEVFPSGSVPLKAYLPDGDIDLTVITSQGTDDYLSQIVLAVLQDKEQKGNSQPEIKHVQYINAEVKLVKCLVDNIMVDISFHQSGGLCSLCFLEKMDQIIGKNHLFKRSIILIKAWCYYESRILGSHHSLLSSYALETMVLYIFHAFLSSLDGPLSVLYRFLDFFSRLDWENYCVSLNGLVHISSLPEIVADPPTTEDGACLLLRDFLKMFEEEFLPTRSGSEGPSSARSFQKRHLNIIDPLKANNNLGRSVNKGNSYRIRSAFAYGARKLGKILTSPKERITEELNKFFVNSIDRCENKLWHEQDASSNSSLSSHEVNELESTPKTNGSSPRRVFYAPHEFFLVEEDELVEPSLLLDLAGDYDTHISNLRYALSCLEGQCPPSLSCFYSGLQLDGLSQVNAVNSLNSNCIFPSTFPPTLMVPSRYNPSRGTGTYIPNMSHWKFRERDQPKARLSSSGKTWRRGPGRPEIEQSASCALTGLTQSSKLPSPSQELPASARKDDPPKIVSSCKEEREKKCSSYQLKNDDDFPPLLS